MPLIRKIIITLIATAHPTAFSAMPPINCNINGDWYQEGTPWYQFHFVQLGSILLGTSPYPQYGGLIASGSVSPSGINFYVTAVSEEPMCDYRADIKATFIRSCSAMLWQVTQYGQTNESLLLEYLLKSLNQRMKN